MKITALVALQPGLEVVPQERQLEELAKHDVLVQVHHCSVGRGDVDFLQNAYEISDLRFPLAAGHELTGVVVACGEGVNNVQVGDKVGVGYQISSCGTCEYCLSRRENLCRSQKCLVLHGQGGFASHIVAQEQFVFKIPSGMDAVTAAPLFCSGLTIYSAIKKAKISAEMQVGVVGIGGLGHIGVQILHYFGAVVTAFSNKSAASVMKIGADQVATFETENIATEVFDRIFVTTPARIDYDYYLSRLKPDGELWVVGSHTNPSTFPSWRLNDFANRSIRGSYIGRPSEMQELLALADKHHISAVVKAMPITELNAALQTVNSGHSDFRIVVTNNGELEAMH